MFGPLLNQQQSLRKVAEPKIIKTRFLTVYIPNLVSYAVESVRRQYERYPYPSYTKRDLGSAANWLTQRGLKSERVIDVGCGTGLWAVAFAVNGSEVTAVDFSKASLSMAAEMADKFGVSIDFFHSDLFSFQSSKKFGIVFCNGVLHHTGDARAGFHQISKLVDKGGLLVISLYNRLSPFRLAKFLVRGLGGDDIETRRNVARTVVQLPLLPAFLGFLGRSQGGPFSSVHEYISKDQNLVDLLCHAHTSYHTLWEIEAWYLAEGFLSFATFPSGTFVSAILPNLLFYVGRRPA